MSEHYVHPDDIQEVFQLMADALIVDDDLVRRSGLTPLVTEPVSPPEQIEFSDWQTWYIGLNKYNILGAVARQQAEAAVRSTGRDPEQYVRMGFDSGFSVIAKFLPQAVAAYNHFTTANSVQPSIEGLTTILHTSYSTVAKFAATDIDTGRKLENNYGLRSPANPNAAGFEVVEHSAGYNKIVPAGWEKLLMNISYSKSPEEAARRVFVNAGARCLALRYLVPATYRWSVDFAASAQELLPADIERTNA